MIRALSIRNLAVIDSVELTFGSGLHVLTGETGAGKSIMIDAISLVLGARGSSELVRHGAKKAEIAALFEFPEKHPVWQKLDDYGLNADDDGTLLIKRDIAQNGKSTCRVNGQIVTLTMLRQIGSLFIDVHGQHDHQSLLREEEHVAWLDAYAGEQLQRLKQEYRQLYSEYRQVEHDHRRLTEGERETVQRIDLLEFQAKEIAAARLSEDEEERLQRRRQKLAHMEKLVQHVQDAYYTLKSDGQVMNDISRALAQVETAAGYDPELNDVAEMVRNAYYQLEEAAVTLGRQAEGQEFDERELNEVEARLHVIEQLKRKYGSTVRDIIQYGERVEAELDVLKNRESHSAELKSRLDELQKQLIVKARGLSQMRREAARTLEQEVERELAQLHMKQTTFRIEFQALARAEEDRPLYKDGWDRLRFAISPNPGEPPKPLAKIASGGELSRVMLALKTIFHDVDEAGTLIFDEIDTGVSGRAAQAIAEKLYRIAKKRQVLCVTHLPQVASMADCHFYIDKQVESDSAVTNVRVLSQQDRINELARMLGGVEVTQKTKQHAEEMLRLAAQSKKGA